MRVLFFTTGMTAGGAERVIATLANEFAAGGHDVCVTFIKGDHSEYRLDPRVKTRPGRLNAGLSKVPAAARHLRRAVREFRPDVVISFLVKADLIALSLPLGVPVIVSERADPFRRSGRMQRLCNLLYPRASAVVCQSEAAASYYRERSPRSRLVVIPNPLDEAACGEASTRREPRIVTVGRLSAQKDHRLAIEAFSRIAADHPELSLEICGEGPLREDLEALIASKGLEGRVLLRGVVANPVRARQNAAAFLFTSRSEGFPNALLEAAATGIPCVTTDFSPGTAREIVADGITGHVVSSRDPGDIARALEAAWVEPFNTADLREHAERLRTRHDVSMVAEQWMVACASAVGVGR